MSDAPAPVGAPATQQATPGAQSTSTAKPGETPAQTEARRLKLVIDGQERELDESEIVAKYKRGENAQKLLSEVDKRRTDALKAKAEAEGLLGRLKDKGNLPALLADLGYTKDDLRRMSEAQILEAIEEERLTPAERELRAEREKVKKYETERQKAEREKQEAAFAEEVERHKNEIAERFMAVMEATGLPRESGRFVLSRLADVYARATAADMDVSEEEAAHHVMAGLRKEHQAVLSGLKGQALVEWLGEANVKEVLRYNLEVNRAKRGQPQQVVNTAPPSAEPKPVDPRKGRVDFRELSEGRWGG